MHTLIHRSRIQSLTFIATAALFAACGDSAPLAPVHEPTISAAFTSISSTDKNNHDDRDREKTLATLRRVTDRYHDLNVAIKDGFVFLHGCETRGDEGPVGMVYVHPGRLTDGVLDARKPDALVYEPGKKNRPKLVAVEMAIPYSLWSGRRPPKFLGATFQREDEFGVFGLHVWIWRHNPEGMFAESNPNVSCGAE